MKAAVESGYVNEMYSSIEYQNIENAYKTISKELMSYVFEEK